MKSSARRRMMLVGSILITAAAISIMGFRHGVKPSDAVAGGDASNAVAGREHLGPEVFPEGSLVASEEGRVIASENSAAGRSFSSSSAALLRSGSFAAASSPVEEGGLDAAPLTRTKVRDRSVDFAGRFSGEKREHGSRAEAAGMPSAAGVTGTVTSPSQQGAEPSGESEEASPEKVKPAELPLVYRLSDEELLEHSPGISPEVLEPIRDQFDRDAGVGELSPADPEYTRRWNVAGPTADERYRTLFGWAAYNDMSRRAAQAGQQ